MSNSRKVSRKANTPVTPVQPLLVNIKTAAAMLGCTVWAVRNLLWQRKVPFLKLGKKFVIDPADLREFIARQKNGGVA